jgi:hypothetical protein
MVTAYARGVAGPLAALTIVGLLSVIARRWLSLSLAPPDVERLVVFLLAAAFAAAAAMLILFLPSFVLDTADDEIVRSFASLGQVWMVACLFVVLWFAARSFDGSSQRGLSTAALGGAYTGVVLPFSFLLSFLIALLPGLAFEWYVTRHIRCRHAKAIVSRNVTWLLHTLEHYPEWRNRARSKRTLLAYISELARVFEGEIISISLSQQEAFLPLVTRAGKRVGAGIRELGTWVALPKADTDDALRARLSEVLLSLDSGNLGELPQCEPAPTVKAGVKNSLLRWLRRAVVALLPILLYEALARTLHLPQNALSDYLRSAAILWTVVATLEALDPELRKVETVKGLLTGRSAGGPPLP